jgi:hypothetical protein
VNPVLRRHPGKVPLLIFALCVLLAAVIYLEADQPAIEPSVAAAPATRVAKPAPPPIFAMPPVGSLAEVLARPLFSESRRPPLPAPANDAGTSPFSIVGIIISARESHALVAHGQPAQTDRVTEGQEIDGWSVDKILPDRVVFGHAGARFEVKAKDPPSAPGPQLRHATVAAAPNLAVRGVQLRATPRGEEN